MKHISLFLKQISSFCREAHWLCTENSYTFYSVSSSDLINHIIIHKQINSIRCLPFRNIIRSLLQLDLLFVSKLTQIMHQLKRIFRLTISTGIWLLYNSSCKERLLIVPTDLALKNCIFHFWVDVTATNHNSLDRDQFVDVLWIEVSHSGLFS